METSEEAQVDGDQRGRRIHVRCYNDVRLITNVFVHLFLSVPIRARVTLWLFGERGSSLPQVSCALGAMSLDKYLTENERLTWIYLPLHKIELMVGSIKSPRT